MDVFKYLRKADAYLAENDESQARKDAERAGGVTSKFGRYYDSKGQYVGQVKGDKFVPASQDDLASRMANSPAGQAETEKEKTLSDFRKDAPTPEETPSVTDQLAKNVPGGPDATALESGDKQTVKKMLARGRESTMSAKRKAQIDQQADGMIAQADAETKAIAAQAAAEAEAENQAEIDAQSKLIDAARKEQEDADKKQARIDSAPKPVTMQTALNRVKDDKVKEKTGEVEALLKDEPDADNIADLQDTMLELRKLAGEQATDAVKKSEAKYAKYMDKVFKPFEDLISNMDAKKQNSFVALVANAHKFTGRANNGAGLNSLGKFDVEQLALSKDRMFNTYDFDDKTSVEKFVRSVRDNEVDDELVDATFDILPKKLKQTWGKKGMAGKGELGKNHFLGYDEDGNEMRGNGGVDRAKYVWKMYLEQGGVDAYTGLPLNIDNIDLEHIRPASKAEGDLEEFKTREHEKNWVLVNANVNQAKSDLSMEEFFEKQVDPLSEKDDGYWETRSDIFDYRNSIPTKESELMSAFVTDDGKIVDGMSPELFMGMMDNHEAGLKKTKKELGVVANESGDKEIKSAWDSIETQSKIAKEVITALGLPRGYNKQKNVEGSKPRSNSMGSDNYYRGVFLSMVGKSPEEQENIKSTYRDAIRHAEDSGGGDAAFASYMVENGGVDMERIGKYKSLTKMFKTLQEEAIIWGKSFLAKYNKNNRFL
jgi:hypothetical protein